MATSNSAQDLLYVSSYVSCAARILMVCSRQRQKVTCCIVSASGSSGHREHRGICATQLRRVVIGVLRRGVYIKGAVKLAVQLILGKLVQD